MARKESLRPYFSGRHIGVANYRTASNIQFHRGTAGIHGSEPLMAFYGIHAVSLMSNATLTALWAALFKPTSKARRYSASGNVWVNMPAAAS